MSRENAMLAGVLVLICACVFGLGGRHLETPGLYYDEVIQATPASEFLRDGGEPLSVPGAQNTWLFGGWFPVMTQPYMGALKSQLLIPSFALFGAERESLRLLTLAWSCLGLVLLTLWARSLYGTRTALAFAMLLALDPSFVFVSRHDWGSVSLALICRGGGLLWITTGWQRRSVLRLAAGGLLLGLGVYNKIDFAGFLVGAGLALLLTLPRDFWTGLRDRAVGLAAAAAGAVVGAAPMWVSLVGVLTATQAMLRSEEVRSGALAEKIQTWQHMLDGSHFHRLMLSGGNFEGLGGVEGAATGAFLWVFAISSVGLGAWLWHDRRRGLAWRSESFALLATLGIAITLLLIPRAARIHHTMNVYPFPQLVVALFLNRLWATPRGPRAPALAWMRRGLAAGAAAAVVAGHFWVDTRTLATLTESGGRGRWSGALEQWALSLPDDASVVSLDWGFHNSLRFVRPELQLEESVWSMHSAGSRPFQLAGMPNHVYLVQESGYEVFPFGKALLDSVLKLPMGDVRITRHTDRLGDPAFVSIRFDRPHELVYRGGFEVRLQ